MDTMKYFDKNGKEIVAGMRIKHDNGDIELVYASEEDLGVNASNENHSNFCEPFIEIYPLSQFSMKEWEIIEETGEEQKEEFKEEPKKEVGKERVLAYKDFNLITDDEIKYILYDIFKGKVKSIDRAPNRINVTMDTPCENEFFEDRAILTEDNINVLEFIVTGDEIRKYEQFLLARGYSVLLKDNKYLDGEL